MLFIIFGLAGAGKTYVGEQLHKQFGLPFYDGDAYVPDAMRQAIAKEAPITGKMRNELFENIVQGIEKVMKQHKDVVFAQAFIKERFRQELQKRFPEVQFILVTASPKIRLQRLSKRAVMPMSKKYLSNMDKRFQKPLVPHVVVKNNNEGKVELIPQLERIVQGLHQK